MKSPAWTRDELILALDLYNRLEFWHNQPKESLEIVKLSDFLNKLPIHQHLPREQKFRNNTGVYMKLCNFLRFDDRYQGKGLEAGSRLEEAIWNEYSNKPEKLADVTRAISNNYTLAERVEPLQEDEEFSEGEILTRIHKLIERNAKMVKEKKKSELAVKGLLACEVCGFNFQEYYGKSGEGFIECHHKLPLSELDAKRNTKLSELALVCSNCHSMLHRARPWKTIEELRESIVKT